MIKHIRYKLADMILPADHVIIRNFYKPAPLYIEFSKGIDYEHCQDCTSSEETGGEQLQTFESDEKATLQ